MSDTDNYDRAIDLLADRLNDHLRAFNEGADDDDLALIRAAAVNAQSRVAAEGSYLNLVIWDVEIEGDCFFVFAPTDNRSAAWTMARFLFLMNHGRVSNFRVSESIVELRR